MAMDVQTMAALGKAGAAMALGISSVGSSIGAGMAGMAAVGAWKKCYAQNKIAPFILVAFVGAPLSQTIYGMILMNAMKVKVEAEAAAGFVNWPTMLLVGLFSGIGISMSALFQGKCGAAASDALGETGKGFGNYLMTLGITETVALFVMVFSMMYIK